VTVIGALKNSELREDEAIERLSRSPRWVWGAMAPESKLLFTIDVGAYTLAMAQAVMHQVALLVTPDCVPLFLTDGHKAYCTAILAHFGYWFQPRIPGAHWYSTGQLNRPGVAVPLLASSPLCFHRDAGAMAIKIRTSLSLMFSRR